MTKMTSEQILDAISPRNRQKDVEYYNKEIIKIKQRNNKVTDTDKLSATPSSSGLVPPCVTPLIEEVVLSPISPQVRGQEEALPDFSHLEYQAPTSPPEIITEQHVKRAVIQYYQNAGANKLQKHKLKIRLNCDFGDGEESVEFIAALTQDLGNFKKYHPEESRQHIQQWVDQYRIAIKQQCEVKAHLGKFHNNTGWNSKGTQFNQIEPWTACLVWYDKELRRYKCLIKIYSWEAEFELTTDNHRQAGKGQCQSTNTLV
jgi:hypothetical protein